MKLLLWTLHVSLMLIAFRPTVSAAAPWTVKDRNGQRIVETVGAAQVGNLQVDAFLSLLCNQVGEPIAWLDYTVSDIDQVAKSFDLLNFEGPDAPAQSKQLVSIEIEGDKASQTLHAHASGWASAEHTGGFGFGIGGLPAESAHLSKLIHQMAREGTVLKIQVTSFARPQHIIESEFPLTAAREALTTLAAFCR
jgi:hypothetical protein